MSITLNKPFVKDLINFKIRFIVNEVDTILKRWNEDNIDDFLHKAKDGRLEEAENDAIDLKQLLFDEEKLRNILNSF